MHDKTVIEDILQYQFRNPVLLNEALTADGAGQSRSRSNARKHGNKGLAMIGDAILRLVLVDDGVRQGNSLGESAARLQQPSFH